MIKGEKEKRRTNAQTASQPSRPVRTVNRAEKSHAHHIVLGLLLSLPAALSCFQPSHSLDQTPRGELALCGAVLGRISWAQHPPPLCHRTRHLLLPLEEKTPVRRPRSATDLPNGSVWLCHRSVPPALHRRRPSLQPDCAPTAPRRCLTDRPATNHTPTRARIETREEALRERKKKTLRREKGIHHTHIKKSKEKEAGASRVPNLFLVPIAREGVRRPRPRHNIPVSTSLGRRRRKRTARPGERDRVLIRGPPQTP